MLEFLSRWDHVCPQPGVGGEAEFTNPLILAALQVQATATAILITQLFTFVYDRTQN